MRRGRDSVDLSERAITILQRSIRRYDAQTPPPYNFELLLPEGSSFTGTLENEKRDSDMLWCLDAPIVSDQLREILERFQPTGLRFVPLRLRVRGKLYRRRRYWMVHSNWLVKCHNEVIATWAGKPNESFLRHYMLDQSRVPPSAHVFGIWACVPVVCISPAVVAEMKQQKITGCPYFPPYNRNPYRPLW